MYITIKKTKTKLKRRQKKHLAIELQHTSVKWGSQGTSNICPTYPGVPPIESIL